MLKIAHVAMDCKRNPAVLRQICGYWIAIVLTSMMRRNKLVIKRQINIFWSLYATGKYVMALYTCHRSRVF